MARRVAGYGLGVDIVCHHQCAKQGWRMLTCLESRCFGLASENRLPLTFGRARSASNQVLLLGQEDRRSCSATLFHAAGVCVGLTPTGVTPLEQSASQTARPCSNLCCKSTPASPTIGKTESGNCLAAISIADAFAAGNFPRRTSTDRQTTFSGFHGRSPQDPWCETLCIGDW